MKTCAICQVAIEQDNLVVAGEEQIPCCLRCWEQIPAGQKLLIAQRFMLSLPATELIERLSDYVIENSRFGLNPDFPDDDDDDDFDIDDGDLDT